MTTIVTGFNWTPPTVETIDYFHVTGAELDELANAGDQNAVTEIQRRAVNKANKRAAVKQARRSR
jgi:hypothetical protein